MSNTTRLRLVLGAASFGAPGLPVARVHTLPECQQLVDAFIDAGHGEIDTARRYAGGTSEEYLGQLDLHGILLDTKLFPASPGAFSAAQIPPLLATSQRALQQYPINVLYMHMPDRSVPFEETVRALDALHKEGKFKEFGLSNFNAWEVMEIDCIARAHGWIRPTVYQGLYNAVERQVETELLPCLRKLGIRFYAYSPLAGGLLSGTLLTTADFDARRGSRWDRSAGSPYAQYLHDTYAPLLPGLRELKETLDKEGILMGTAALRWLQHHSQLSPEAGDGVIVGSSNVQQLKANMADSAAGPLPAEIVTMIDALAAEVRGKTGHYAK